MDICLDRAQNLTRTLMNFGVEGTVDSVIPGPVVTTYKVKLAPGIKASRVISLCDDLAIAMGVANVRASIIADESVVGIEVPNSERTFVYLRKLVELPTYKNPDMKLPMVLGMSALNEPVIVDLAGLPHLLVAGATGTGKSVFLNSVIMGLINRLGPLDLELILIDPKRIEFSAYANLPHLRFPVVTDAEQVPTILSQMLMEMEFRYQQMQEAAVRNIGELRAKGVRLPYMVLVVDEFADMMLTGDRKLIEQQIVRLAQKGRAAGIHLIIATQRPSVGVVTGLIKANFPARVAFQMASRVDSRTIIDAIGAERLLGMGDMLYTNGPNKTRIQGAFVSDKQIHGLVTQHVERISGKKAA